MNAATEKKLLRNRLRKARRDYVAALPRSTRALIFMRPPAPLVELVPEGEVVGIYHAVGDEAPTRAYANWFHENGRTVALPWSADRDSLMCFREWRDPLGGRGLSLGPFGIPQPWPEAREVIPRVVLVPLLGFTSRGERLGQGGGHYDQWLAEHPETVRVGLAWDCQLVESLPLEEHDRRLDAVVTPTRFYEAE